LQIHENALIVEELSNDLLIHVWICLTSNFALNFDRFEIDLVIDFDSRDDPQPSNARSARASEERAERGRTIH